MRILLYQVGQLLTSLLTSHEMRTSLLTSQNEKFIFLFLRENKLIIWMPSMCNIFPVKHLQTFVSIESIKEVFEVDVYNTLYYMKHMLYETSGKNTCIAALRIIFSHLSLLENFEEKHV